MVGRKERSLVRMCLVRPVVVGRFAGWCQRAVSGGGVERESQKHGWNVVGVWSGGCWWAFLGKSMMVCSKEVGIAAAMVGTVMPL